MEGGSFYAKALWIALLLSLILVGCGQGAGGLKEGAPAPDFHLPTATGEIASLSDYVGRQPVLLFFHMAAG
ncbi:MAG: hypothetical protein ACUVWB_06355 [Anaerolineae bacterium]